MTKALHCAVLGILTTIAACGGERDAGADAGDGDASIAERTSSSGSGPVVATVDGDPITLAEVQTVVDATGLSALDALRRLEEERVLYHHASSSRSLETAEADHGARRAAVQALLRARVETAVAPASITEAEILARYDSMRASFAQPERRASVHVLAELPPDADERALAAAERFTRRVISELSAEADPALSADRYRTEDSEGRVFRVRVEHLPPASRRSPLEAPYLDALFSRASPGVVPEPVRTAHGLHAVVVSSIEPPFRVPVAEAEAMLRQQLLAEHRGAVLDALTGELAARTPVQIDERALARALEADLFEDEPALGSARP